MSDSADAAWVAVRSAQPSTMSRDQVATLLTQPRTMRSRLDAVEVAGARRLRELASIGQSEQPTELLQSVGGCTGREARVVTTREALCADVPRLESALVAGEVTAGQLDAIARAGTSLPDEVRDRFHAEADLLLRRATLVSLDVFHRECRELAQHLLVQSRGRDDVDELAEQRAASKVTRWIDRHTGMHHTNVRLDPVRDAKLNAAISAGLARARAAGGVDDWQQIQVEALLAAVCGRAPSPGVPVDDADASVTVDRVPEITGLVDLRFLNGEAESGVCETENGELLPISTMRRLCCDAEIIPIVLGGRGEVLDQGRSMRTATRAQRRALRAMHRGCAHPSCDVGFDACRIHHVRWWWRDLGPTDLDNLLPLCEAHHHLVHEGGWSLTMTKERVATWTRPDNVVHHVGSTIDRRPMVRPQLL